MPTKTKRATKAKKPIKSKKTLAKRAAKKAVKKAVNKAFRKAVKKAVKKAVNKVVKKGGEGTSIAPMAAAEQQPTQDGPQPEPGPATLDPTGTDTTQNDPS